MVKASIEVHSRTAHFRVAVQAESTQRALSRVAGRYAAGTCRVTFPTGVEDFSVEGLLAQAGMKMAA
jgi:hypothetical protein